MRLSVGSHASVREPRHASSTTCRVPASVRPLGRAPAPQQRLQGRVVAWAASSSELAEPVDVVRELNLQTQSSLDAEAAAEAAAAAEAEAVMIREAERQRMEWVMSDTASFLAQDLKMLFEKGQITETRYSPAIKFEDPITKYDTRDGYLLNIRLLRSLFNIAFELHTIGVSSVDTVTATWTMEMVFWLLPWKPTLTLTGRTVYGVDPRTGIVLSHVDYWDALNRNAFLSLEGLQEVVRQFLDPAVTPPIETPKYSVLKRYKDYEIRKYDAFTVAETTMTAGAGPASGSGFSSLAGYLFGGNQQQLDMAMTTPVLQTIDPRTNSSVAMQFVMERRYSDPSALPEPADPRVVPKREEPRYAAAIKFGGWPLDYEVVQAERQLRDWCLRDGLRPAQGYQLARYNDPSTPPALRRNEVLIKLDDFSWPPPPPTPK
ncbi:hypothetical protein HYH03_008531 [Edaphochlamys debaryana]|uniref:SOUL heme-binding protein n=1 Tax=Edaphochlamys debaryana TaxID=47281 RepID=A0A836BYB3_9CHLO|nr:hypothetical protein HYH03_008531 [Edaphochlamys debaryana]|eukprot:KAG2493405.1 hypothetical protein HYH03_008531 [Edaphochlamys debaryana]